MSQHQRWPSSSDLDQALRERFRQLIELRFGMRLSEQQLDRLDEATSQILAISDYGSASELYRTFAAGLRPDLCAALAARLTIGETHFFRVAPQIEALRTTVLPRLRAARSSRRQLRVWSAGCSTGEEPYTLAILLRQALGGLEPWDVEVLATDINLAALEMAQRGAYGEWSFRETPELIRANYFTPEGRRWQISQVVRDLVRFAHLNLASESLRPPIEPGLRFDLIVCRNVTIYFTPEVTQRLYRQFADLLAPDGWLLLGPSDPVPQRGSPLEAVCLPGAVVWRKEQPAQSAPSHQPVSPRSGGPTVPLRRAISNTASNISPRRRADAVATSAATSEVELGRIREYMDSGQFAAAREQAERLVQASPLDADAHLLLGMLYLDSGETQLALSSLRRVAFLNPASSLGQFSLGRAYLLSGDRGRAQAAFTHARRVLASISDEEAIWAGGGLLAGELRHAVETQLASLGQGGGRA